MHTPDLNGRRGYYFALPRLLAGSPEHAVRSEQNWLEVNIVGALVHAITFIFAARLILAAREFWQQVLLIVPVAFLVWAWWSIFFYAVYVALKLLRRAGLARDLADRHAQSFAVGSITTLFAWQLIEAGSWMRSLGWIWIIAVALNLIAAAALALRQTNARR